MRETVDRLIAQWLAEHARTSYPLVVAHTHGHGDHVAGDPAFGCRPDTTVVGEDCQSVVDFYGFTRWPDQVVQVDLGGRVLEITGTPGHHECSISILDAWTGFLLTGETVYPGRLCVQDMAAFTASLDRMLRLAESRGVRHVMGCHIEMSRTPGRTTRSVRHTSRRSHRCRRPKTSCPRYAMPQFRLRTRQVGMFSITSSSSTGRPGRPSPGRYSDA